MAKQAVLLSHEDLGGEHSHLAKILDFFGVPWERAQIATLWDMERNFANSAIFSSLQTASVAFAEARRRGRSLAQDLIFYAYADANRKASERALQALIGTDDISLQKAPEGKLLLSVSSEQPNLTGPMGGVTLSLSLRSEDNVLLGVPNEISPLTNIISAGDASLFVRFQVDGIPIFFCASSEMIDIDYVIGPGYYDVKGHFCSVVPLVMFIKHIFREVAWHPQELGACLIIDDPLLRPRYGSCDFRILLKLMCRYGFTTNIAFIPWNWRRTSPADAKFFRAWHGLFSVSIHGCDHIEAEFGRVSSPALNSRARLAQLRMKQHEVRTGIHHETVMVFPQGVFSSASAEALKRNGYLAAANTETSPVDSEGEGTRVRDVWDVAILKYGDFPIFSRRYAKHGLENFAFDLLLGKPCLIVAHHDFFSDDCTRLIELIEKLESLPCTLTWRPLGEVIRRACRRRAAGAGKEAIEMYGSELLIDNSFEQAIDVHILKRENEADIVAEVLCDQKPIMWKAGGGHLSLRQQWRHVANGSSGCSIKIKTSL